MAYLDKSWKRLIRIEGEGKRPDGKDISVYDAETGEQLLNILSITLRIRGRGNIEADIIYHKMDSDIPPALASSMPVEESITVQDVEIFGSIQALETEER
jgi:hypothetical protein